MMLAPNPKLLDSKAPHSECHEALAKPPQGKVSTPTPVAIGTSRPVVRGSTRDGGKEGPMWRTVLIAQLERPS
jgi:hypothetical protein